MKPIRRCFALVGLLLHAEHGFTGREVHRAHMRLARLPERWPVGGLPEERGRITATDVLIRTCARAVWDAFRESSRDAILELLRRRGIV